jgi:hypothetical protein
MKGQYEQQCNAAALKALGVPVLKKLRKKFIPKIKEWTESDYRIEINYPYITAKIVHSIFEDHVQNLLMKNKWKKDYHMSFPIGRQK